MEFRIQGGSVLVVPDHPQFNASTLRYYAELQRLPVRFARILDGAVTTERLQTYDFILTKSGGYQGPEFSTRAIAEIQAVLSRGNSGFIRLPEAFEFPDDSQIELFERLEGPP